MVSEGFPRHVFRAYDIRGVYGRDLTEEFVEAVARSYGTMLGNRGEVLVGRDVRLSGEKLASAVSRGLKLAGCDVIHVGIVPTPLAYFGVIYWKLAGGIQITASHNPPEWNGLKMITSDGDTVSEGAGMETLKEMVLERRWRKGERVGVEENRDVVQPYLDHISKMLKIERRLKVAIDYSNGATALVFPRLAEMLEMDVVALNEKPDGMFPGHLPEPNEETLKNLQRLVVSEGADFGVGFDGDGDRAVFVDDRGRLMPGDITLAVFVKFLHKRGKVVFDVNSSTALREVIIEKGCEPVEMRVGRAFLLRAVREMNAVIGGEKSNHLYFPELWGFDDAMYAAAKMAEILSKTGKRLSEIIEEFPKYPSTPIMVFECPDEIKWRVVESIAEKLEGEGVKVSRIDGVKAYFDDGWLLIRPSNTMPQVKMSAEAKSEKRLRELVKYGKKLIEEAKKRVR